jgi:hypothetical protein
MYPSDDGPLRLRLLIAQSRAVRQRLEARVADLMELRSRRPGAETQSPPPLDAERQDFEGRAARAERSRWT